MLKKFIQPKNKPIKPKVFILAMHGTLETPKAPLKFFSKIHPINFVEETIKEL